jgi:hypothetical protein
LNMLEQIVNLFVHWNWEPPQPKIQTSFGPSYMLWVIPERAVRESDTFKPKLTNSRL